MKTVEARSGMGEGAPAAGFGLLHGAQDCRPSGRLQDVVAERPASGFLHRCLAAWGRRALPSNPQGFRASTSVAAAPTAPSLRGANEGGCRLVDASGADGEGDRTQERSRNWERRTGRIEGEDNVLQVGPLFSEIGAQMSFHVMPIPLLTLCH